MRAAGTSLFLSFCLLGMSCRHGRSSGKVEPALAVVNGFTAKETAAIDETIETNELRISRLQDEAKWLKLQARLVEARRVAARTKGAELELSSELAKYGRLDESLPGSEGFLLEEQRRIWNSRLQARREASQRTAAAARLLARELEDFQKELRKKYEGIEFKSPLAED